MEAEAFERVYQAFQEFHTYFAGAFGRKQWREQSQYYLQGLLVQSQERRNAENLSEMVPVSARSMQRFLTEARWDDDAVIARLQEYLGPKLEHPLAVWVFDGSDFPKQGVKSVGVARQYCGALGKIANCQAGVFLAHVGPRGRALVDKRLYLPKAWSSDACRCAAAGVPEDRRSYRSKTGLALEMLKQARARGCLSAGWAAGDDAFGMSPAFRDGLAAQGTQYVLDVRPDMTVWPLEPVWIEPAYQGFGRPRQPKLRRGQRLTMAERSLALPEESWREITVAEGSQGPRTYRFGAQRVRETRDRKPGPATSCPTLPRTLPWRLWPMWEGPGGALKPNSRQVRATSGWMSTRPGPGRGGITISPCACWAERFCWVCSRTGGKKMPLITRPQVYRVVREMLPREWFGPGELLQWLEDVQRRNERAKRSHEKRRAARRLEASGVPP